MADFGKYQAGSELATGAFTSVYAGRKGGSSHAYAIKVLKPTPELWTPKETERQISAFLARAELQQKAWRSGRRHWAPMYAMGRQGDGAYYVTEQYPLSVETLIDRHISLNSKRLHGLTLGIVRGLQALDRATGGQAHGNLHPNNVLLRRRGGGKYGVHLTDPAIGGGMGERTADLQALGALVQALITHKPVDPNREWTLGGLESYAPLGSRANAWREFVGKLLGVGTQLAFTDLAEVAEALKALRPRSKVLTLVLIPAAILVVGAAVFTLAYPREARRVRNRLFAIVSHVTSDTTQPATTPSSNSTTSPVVIATTHTTTSTNDVDGAAAAARAEAERKERERQAMLDKQRRDDEEQKRLAAEREAARQRQESQRMADEAAQRAENERKLWLASIITPPLQSNLLKEAWINCRYRWTAPLKAADDKVKAALDQLGAALLEWEQALPDPKTVADLPAGLVSTASARRDTLFGELAETLKNTTSAGVPDTLSPTARTAAKAKFQQWVRERGAAAKLSDAAMSVLKADPAEPSRERDVLTSIDGWMNNAATDAPEREKLAELRKQIAALPEARAKRVADLLESARAHDNEADGRDALATLDKVLKLDPDNADAIKLKLKIKAYYELPTNWDDLVKVADAGNVKASREVADRYLTGRDGTPKNPAAAIKYLETVAQSGDVASMATVGQLYASGGNGVQPDYKRAMDWLTKAASAGNGPAMTALGDLYTSGKGLSAPDPATALSWYDKAAASGDAGAMLHVGRLHLNANPPEYRAALQWFQKAADKGNADAAMELAHCYANGLGVRRDVEKAKAMYEQAAKSGNAEAMFLRGKLAVEAREKGANRWIAHAAEAGHPEAMHYLGQMYNVGLNVDQSYDQALAWNTKAANAGSVGAMVDLAQMYYDGTGVRKDPAQALPWFEKAAKAGNVNAMFTLGVMYQKGQGVAADQGQAFKCFLAAAQKGNSNAMRRVAQFYETGVAGAADRNPTTAADWRRKADAAAANGQ